MPIKPLKGPKCPLCQGSGEVEKPSFSDPTRTSRRTCTPCKGSGTLPIDYEKEYRKLLKKYLKLEASITNPPARKSK